MVLSRNTFEPLYYQIREHIREKINNNEYPPNSMIPSEAELCEIYDVSRVTVRRAILDLVQEGLLTDYKVIVLAMDQKLVGTSLQARLADPTSGLVLDDATRILGCYKALAKMDIQSDLGADTQPMRRALAFCRDIKSSKLV